MPYFALAVLTHLLNVSLLFSIISRTARSDALACFGATAWGISPVLLWWPQQC